MFLPTLLQRRGTAVNGRVDQTAPGGPSPDILAAARGLAAGRGDATALRGSREQPAAPRLLITGGPHKGAEFALLDSVITLGRARSNGLTVADVSMSRRHSRLERQGDRWVLFDQNSGNGTRVNGRPARRHRLRHGDEIEMGDTTFRFLEAGGVLVWPAALVPGRLRFAAVASWMRGPGLVSGALAVALATVAGAVLIRERRLSAAAEARARIDATRALARNTFQEGVALVAQGRWREGRDKLRVAAELDGQDARIARQLAAAEEELARLESPQTSADSPPAIERQIDPGKSARIAPPARRRRIPPPQPDEAARILEAYLTGDLATAVDRARAARTRGAQRVAEPLTRLISAWRDGLAEPDVAASLRSLEAAAETDRAIARGREGRVGRDLGRALAVRHLAVAQGMEGEDDLPLAMTHLRAAARADPGNGEVEARLRHLADRAGELYLQAYMAKDDDPERARTQFRPVLQTLPPTDDMAVKAMRWLEELDGRVAQ
jgi:pSer/pThr/pTyr-binding forkhead associated (FHA) protein